VVPAAPLRRLAAAVRQRAARHLPHPPREEVTPARS